jgi:hypothetical protein
LTPAVEFLKLTLLCGLGAPIVPVSGVETFTNPPVVANPLWKAVGKTLPSGCWN